MSNFIIHHAMIEFSWLGYCMHNHQLPTIFLNPVLLLDQLIELLATEYSSKMSEKHDEQGPFPGGLEQRGLIR